MTATVTGLVEDEAESLIDYSLSRASGEDVGDYTITVSGEKIQGNYTVIYVTGTFKITKATGADLDITSYSGIYDGDNHGIEITNTIDDDVVYYSTDDKVTWISENPVFSDVGEYSVAVRVENKNNEDRISSGTVAIVKATIDRVQMGEDISDESYIISRDYTDNSITSENIGEVQLFSNPLNSVDVSDDYNITLYEEKGGNIITDLDSFDLSNGGTTFSIYMEAISINSNNREDFKGYIVFKYGSVTIGDDTDYMTIEDALEKAASGDNIIVKYNTSFAEASVSQLAYGKVTHNVSSGVTLLIPYDSSYSQKLNDTPSGTGGALSQGKAYAKLVMPTGINLDIYGTVTVNAKHANISTKFSGHVTGANYAELEMQFSSKITVQSGGALNSSGFVYGDGEIEALSGSTVYEFLFIKSFRGGTATTRVQGSVFPIDQFTVNSIEAKTTYLSGSKLNAKVLTYMSSSYQKGDINLIGIGSSPIFELKEGLLVKSYNQATGEVTFDLQGDAGLNNTSVQISGINLSSSGKDMPFDGTWNINVSNGSDLQINSYVALLPGAKVTIEDGASATITSNGRVTVFDPYQYITDGHIKNYPETSQSYYRVAPVFNFNNDTPAVMNVNGELSIEAGGAIAGRVRTGDNGRIILDNKAVTIYEFKYVEDNARVASREVEFEDVDHGVPFRMFFENGPGSFDYNFIYADDSSGNYELTNLPIPTIGDTDFRFDGWYTSRDYLIKVAESFAATGDITVYAKWITDVKFVKNDGSDEESIIPQIYGKDYEYPDWYDETVFWFTDSTDGEPYLFDNPVEKIDHSTVYARWDIEPKIVTFQSNGGTEFDSLSVAEGTVINLDDYEPSKEDAVFQGWYTKGWTSADDFDIESRVSSTVKVEEDIMYYARWAEEESNIKITLSADPTKISGGGNVTLTANVTDDYGPVERVSVMFDAVKETWNKEDVTGQYNSGKYGVATATYSASSVDKTVEFNATEQVTNRTSETVEIVLKSCIADGTLITLADGTQKPVEELKGDELLLVWNLETGSFDIAPIAVNFAESFSDYEIIHLHFSDGTDVKIIDEHAFWDFDLNRYAFINKDNAQEHLGHWFKKQITDADGNLTWTKVELIDVDIKHEYTRAWTPITYEHLSFYANGMLSMTGEIGGIVNTFEVSPDTMKIDQNAYLADIAEYGLFTYEEFAQVINVPEEMFDAFQAKYLKVSIGKGHITVDELVSLIMQYGEWLGIEQYANINQAMERSFVKN